MGNYKLSKNDKLVIKSFSNKKDDLRVSPNEAIECIKNLSKIGLIEVEYTEYGIRFNLTEKGRKYLK